MAAWGHEEARTGATNGVPVRLQRHAVTLVLLSMVCQPGAAHAFPLLAQAGQALVAPGLDQAAKPAKPATDANAPAGGGAAAAAPATGGPATGASNSLMKYLPSYVLMALLIALGTFIICRPKPRVAAK